MKARTAEQLIAAIEALAPALCAEDRRALCYHELLMSVAAGYRSEPRCSPCLARALGQTHDALVAHLTGHFERRECFGGAWRWASERERQGDCRFLAETLETSAPPPPAPDTTAEADLAWNAGDMGCGDLVLELRMRMRALPPGTVLRLTATDLGAPQDIPAWCALTGHALVRTSPPDYWIRRRDTD